MGASFFVDLLPGDVVDSRGNIKAFVEYPLLAFYPFLGDKGQEQPIAEFYWLFHQ